jgi:hypothetical protein
LESALARARDHAARKPEAADAVQLLGQISTAPDWPRIREYWTHRARLTGDWPPRLSPGELTLNLWPVPPDSVKLTDGVGTKPERRQPRKLLSTPALVHFDAQARQASGEEALARAIVSWIEGVVLPHDEFAGGVLLAPPLLEEWAAKGRLVRRSIITFDLDWQLPAAQGVTWPPP